MWDLQRKKVKIQAGLIYFRINLITFGAQIELSLLSYNNLYTLMMAFLMVLSVLDHGGTWKFS